MKILISDIDGTLAKNNHRKHLKDDLDDYFRRAVFDAPNKIGLDLYKSINADLHVIISSRPVRWKRKDDTLLDLWYLTMYWLKYYRIPMTDLLLRNSNVAVNQLQEDKYIHLHKLLDYYKNNELVYLENDEHKAEQIKELFPYVDVNIISSSGARRLL